MNRKIGYAGLANDEVRLSLRLLSLKDLEAGLFRSAGTIREHRWHEQFGDAPITQI